MSKLTGHCGHRQRQLRRQAAAVAVQDTDRAERASNPVTLISRGQGQ
ncbi:MAG: hypothetical protein JO345_10430 [Streptosporangiaceae bacterium]|nr:hypothetical protein [Streptosporangiaceae bacterium]